MLKSRIVRQADHVAGRKEMTNTITWKFCYGILKELKRNKYSVVDGRIILKCTSKKFFRCVWNEFMWFKKSSISGLCILEPQKNREIRHNTITWQKPKRKATACIVTLTTHKTIKLCDLIMEFLGQRKVCCMWIAASINTDKIFFPVVFRPLTIFSMRKTESHISNSMVYLSFQ